MKWTKEELENIFEKNFDCYADTNTVIKAMSKDRYLKVLKDMGVYVPTPPTETPHRGCCGNCGEGYDNEEEWKYNTHCEVCGEPIPENKIIKRPI